MLYLTPLTKRQHEMAEHVMYGLSNKEIAAKLGVSANTVRETLHKVFTKLKLHKRTQLVTWAHLHIGMYDHDRFDP